MFVIKEGDGGSYAYMVQLALARAGYPLIIDGIFGGRTKAAVIDFQKSRGLTRDGIVGKNTFLALREFLTGYTYYTVKQGDTIGVVGEIPLETSEESHLHLEVIKNGATVNPHELLK